MKTSKRSKSVGNSSQSDTDIIRCSIENEYDNLKTVLVHRPGQEIDRLTPFNRQELLFEDVPFLSQMQHEHDEFCQAMKDLGIQVLYLEQLLQDIVVNNVRARNKLVNDTCITSRFPSLPSIILENYSPEEITNLLFCGVTALELKEITGLELGSTNLRDDYFIVEPIPNSYFTRDPAAIVDDGIVSCKAHFPARIRETAIIKTVFQHHPYFSETDFIFGGDQLEDRPFTIEGGDIIQINQNAIAIGCSQRTRAETISKLARKLFVSGRAQRVYEINIPVAREYMHLDTVFTIVAPSVVVAYPDVIDNIIEIYRHEPAVIAGGEIVSFRYREQRRFKQILEEEFKMQLRVINTGNNDTRYAAREQGADGTNTLAVAPGKVIAYDRNIHTNRALKAEGIEVVSIIGSELVRGLGGPRCMTMPLVRDNS